jgi:hypothetical protein
MTNPPVLEWLDENQFRAFPLTDYSTRYVAWEAINYDLYPLILDALLMCSTEPPQPQITQIQTNTTNLTISVTSQTNFVVTNYLTATYPQYVRNSQNSLLVIGSYANTLPQNLTLNVANALFTPSLIYVMPAPMTGVSTINWGGGGLTGSVTINDGYQLYFLPNQTIEVEVSPNNGQPLPCSNVLNITPDCAHIVSSINGVTVNRTGGVVNIVGGNHVNVFDDPLRNRIFIGYDFITADVVLQQLMPPPTIV